MSQSLPELPDQSLGKQLWLAVCATRKVQPDRAEYEWEFWDGDFMTKCEWQESAERFASAIRSLKALEGGK